MKTRADWTAKEHIACWTFVCLSVASLAVTIYFLLERRFALVPIMFGAGLLLYGVSYFPNRYFQFLNPNAILSINPNAIQDTWEPVSIPKVAVILIVQGSFWIAVGVSIVVLFRNDL